MFHRVVVGVDEHHGGRDAIALAGLLAGRYGELILAHIYAITPAGSGSALVARVEHARAGELLEKARAAAGAEARLACVAAGSVGRGLHDVAEVKAADLLVVGSCRRGLIGRVLLGDDTVASLDGAPCAIAIAPAGYAQENGSVREVGVGYDGSAESERALDVARDLAREHGAKLSALEAVPLPTYAFNAGVTPIGLSVETVLGEARERVAALGGVEPHAAYGSPDEELARYSGAVDLLVVGSRGYGPIGRLFHGSTSRRLTRSARCPLLVVTKLTSSRSAPLSRITGA